VFLPLSIAMAVVSTKTDPALWARIKLKWIRSKKGGVAGKWNARKAMLAVRSTKGVVAGMWAPFPAIIRLKSGLARTGGILMATQRVDISRRLFDRCLPPLRNGVKNR
jgi:hypothetical protein